MSSNQPSPPALRQSLASLGGSALNAAAVFSQRLPVDVAAIAEFADGLEQWGMAQGLAPALVARLNLVLDELITNAVLHGFGQSAQPGACIEVNVACSATEVRVSLRDNAQAFNPLSLKPADTTLELEDRTPGGLGVHFVRQLTHDLRYRREGFWNELQFGMQRGDVGASDGVDP